MKSDDIYAQWKQSCEVANVQTDFAARTMQLIHASVAQRPQHARRPAWLSALALAAGILLVVLGHTTTVGMLLCTLTGVAQ